MKLLFLLVVLLTVYTANCSDFSRVAEQHKRVPDEKDFPDGAANQSFIIEPQQVTEGRSGDHDFTKEPHYIHNGLEKTESSDDSEHDTFYLEQKTKKVELEANGSEMPGKMTKRILERFGVNPISMKHDLSQAELLYYYIVINLELKKELQSIREQQNNITDNGKQLKMELQSIRENITNGDMQIEKELKYLKLQQNNITDTNKVFQIKLQTKLENITKGDLQFKLELQSMKELQDNISNTNTETKMEIQSIKGKITNMKQDMTNYSSIIISKLNSSLGNQGRLIYPSRQTTKLNWSASVKRCENMGAQPFVPKSRQDFEIIKKIREEIGSYIWFPASDITSEGSLKWFNGQDASKSPGLVWYKNQLMHSNSASNDCVLLGSDTRGVHMWPCTNTAFPMICSR